MDLPNALYEDMQAWPTGTHIGQGAFVSVEDAMLRSRAGMDPAEILDPDLHLFATIVPPSTDETKSHRSRLRGAPLGAPPRHPTLLFQKKRIVPEHSATLLAFRS